MKENAIKTLRVAIVVMSDGVSAGSREDLSGKALAARSIELGWYVEETHVVPDDVDAIATLLKALTASGTMVAGSLDVILTTGGTGVAPRDVTPEATRQIADRDLPGFGELMRSEGLKKTHFAPLSRSGAYTRGKVLILNLPGSPKGAVDSLNAVAHLVPHVIDLLNGRTEHNAKADPQKPAL